MAKPYHQVRPLSADKSLLLWHLIMKLSSTLTYNISNWSTSRRSAFELVTVRDGLRSILSILMGFVKLLRPRRSSDKRVHLPGPTHPLSGPLRTYNFGPTLEAIPHLLAVLRRG
jgi:hypothetical protein